MLTFFISLHEWHFLLSLSPPPPNQSVTLVIIENLSNELSRTWSKHNTNSLKEIEVILVQEGKDYIW